VKLNNFPLEEDKLNLFNLIKDISSSAYV